MAGVDLRPIHDEKVIGVNNSYGDPVKDDAGETTHYIPRPWVDVLWFGDARWLAWHAKFLVDFMGLKCHCAGKLANVKTLFRVLRGIPEGLDKRPSCIAWNKSSGGSAIDLAAHFGATCIVLLGFDMQLIEGKFNWHNDHHPSEGMKARRLRRAKEGDLFERHLACFDMVHRHAEERGITIINCTPGSLIHQFPIMTLEEFLNHHVEDS